MTISSQQLVFCFLTGAFGHLKPYFLLCTYFIKQPAQNVLQCDTLRACRSAISLIFWGGVNLVKLALGTNGATLEVSARTGA